MSREHTLLQLNITRRMIKEKKQEHNKNSIIIEYLEEDNVSLFNADNVIDLKGLNERLEKRISQLEIKENELLSRLIGNVKPLPFKEGEKRRVKRTTEEIRERMESSR